MKTWLFCLIYFVSLAQNTDYKINSVLFEPNALDDCLPECRPNEASILKWTGAKPEGRPIMLKINRLKVKEEKQGQYMAGEYFLKVDFLYQRPKGDTVKLTGYSIQTEYKRSPLNTAYVEQLQKSTFEKCLKYFDGWWQKNHLIDPAFAEKVLVSFVENQLQTADTVLWQPERKVAWADFRAEPSASSKYSAQIFTSFGYEATAEKQEKAVGVKIKSWAYMVPDMSWYKNSVTNEYTLEHEQLHFDITQLTLLKFRKKILELELDAFDHLSEINYEYIEAYKMLNRLQKAYDGETNHGINKEKQAWWQNQVKKDLDILLNDKRLY